MWSPGWSRRGRPTHIGDRGRKRASTIRCGWLGRQWQMREFAAEDAGSPVSVSLAVDALRADAVRCPTGVAPGRRDGRGGCSTTAASPLEAPVEREPHASLSWRVAADAGVHFERCLVRHRVGEARTPRLPARSSRWSAGPMPGRVINDAEPPGRGAGRRRCGQMPAPPTLPSAPGHSAGGSNANVIAAAQEWLAWFESLVAPPPAITAPARGRPIGLGYQFCAAVATPEREMVMAAQTTRAATWSGTDFTIRYGATLGGARRGARPCDCADAVPAPVTFPGMPASRWWGVRERRRPISSAVNAGPGGIPIRLLLVEFASCSTAMTGFLIPVELPVGTLSRVRSLGRHQQLRRDRSSVEPFSRAAGSGTGWRVFTRHRGGAGSPDAAAAGRRPVLLPPVLGPSVTGLPDEEVAFVRDEMANLVWAIEKTINGEAQSSSPASRPLLRQRRGTATATSCPAASANTGFRSIPGRRHPQQQLAAARDGVLDAAGAPGERAGHAAEERGPMLVHDAKVPRERPDAAASISVGAMERWLYAPLGDTA